MPRVVFEVCCLANTAEVFKLLLDVVMLSSEFVDSSEYILEMCVLECDVVSLYLIVCFFVFFDFFLLFFLDPECEFDNVFLFKLFFLCLKSFLYIFLILSLIFLLSICFL